MGISRTIQKNWQLLRIDHTNGLGDVTKEETMLDGSAAGYTFHHTDRPDITTGKVFALHPEDEQACLICEHADASEDKAYQFTVWGYAAGQSLAEKIADVSGTVGTARINDVTTALYTKTFTVNATGLPDDITTTDCSSDTDVSNSIAHLWFSTYGFQYLYFQCEDLTTGMSVRPKIRLF